MVCIAAFIILGLIGIFVAVISIFKPAVGRAYWQAFKKAAGCVGKKVRLQKCETNFKDDVKNTLLKKIVLKRPQLVKPLSYIIEILSIILVAIFVWAILTAIKSLLALWVLGTCNVTKPAACTFTSEICPIDTITEPTNIFEQTGRWFTEWGDIFAALPNRLRSWRAEDYFIAPTTFVDIAVLDESQTIAQDTPYALDIFDPGCSACMNNFKKQLAEGFFASHRVALLLYPIQLTTGEYKFANSDIIARYFYAAALLDESSTIKYHLGLKLIHKIFTTETATGIPLQKHLASLDAATATAVLHGYFIEFGATADIIMQLDGLAKSSAVQAILDQVSTIVLDQLKLTGIPTLIYDGQKHFGL